MGVRDPKQVLLQNRPVRLGPFLRRGLVTVTVNGSSLAVLGSVAVTAIVYVVMLVEEEHLLLRGQTMMIAQRLTIGLDVMIVAS